MKKRLIAAACVLFWLAVWQVGAMLLGQELLLVSPVRAAGRLLELIPTEGFLRSVAFSSGRILGGFGLGLTCGTLLALLAGKFRFVRTLLAPLVAAVKAVPVASITVLALVWVSSRNLSVLVTFLIALPVVYSNMLESLGSMDPKLTEMAELYHISGWKRFAGVYLSQLLPGFCSAAKLAIGLSWKSGAAAEVIGIPSGSIGEKLYEAKVYLETADLFAWTIAVILLSWLSEKLFLFLVGLAVRAVSGKNAFRCSKVREPDNSPARLRADGVTKRFGGISALDGFSAEFQPGSTTAVMGASGCGKTTLLRDLIRCVSLGEGVRPRRVGVADERGELGAGALRRHLGPRTDVLENCPKAAALLMLLRGMAPQVLAVDEITAPEDLRAIQEAAGCGVTLLATAHGGSWEELRLRPLYRELLDQGIFRTFVVLSLAQGKRVYTVRKEGMP
mgnify:CR=1 FL=1